MLTRRKFVKMHLCGSCVTKMLAHNNCWAKFSMTIMYQYLKQWPAWRLAFIFMVYCNSYLAAKVFFALRQEVWYWPHALISAFIRGGSLEWLERVGKGNTALYPTGYQKRTGQFLRALHVYSVDNFVAFWLKWL